MTTVQAPPAFHVMIKPTGAICNLGCQYCFFLSKEMLYPGDRFRMADDMLERYLRQLLDSHLTPRCRDLGNELRDSIVETDIFEYHFENRGENIMTKEMLLEIGDKYEAKIAANRSADATYR